MSTINATTGQLRSTITEIDSLAQNAFTEIATLSRLALASLETSQGVIDLESLACVLGAIYVKALGAESDINSQAEEVGCNYKDAARTRRFEARRQARASAQHGGVAV